MTPAEVVRLLERHTGNRDARMITARNLRLRALARKLHGQIHEGREK